MKSKFPNGCAGILTEDLSERNPILHNFATEFLTEKDFLAGVFRMHVLYATFHYPMEYSRWHWKGNPNRLEKMNGRGKWSTSLLNNYYLCVKHHNPFNKKM